MKFKILLVFLSFFLVSCDTISVRTLSSEKQKINAEIQKIEKEKQEELEKKVKEVEDAKNLHFKQLEQNFQLTSDWLYGGRLGLDLIEPKERLWSIIDSRLKTSAAYAPAPSKEAIEEQNRLLKEELNTTKVSNEELKRRYDAKIIEAKNATDLQESYKKQIEEKEQKLQEIEKQYYEKLKEKDQELKNLNDKIISFQQKELEIAKDSQESLHKIIYIFVGLAVVGGFLAWFFQSWEAALFSAICLGVSVTLPFLKLWMVLTFWALICSGIGIFLWMKISKKHSEEKNIADRAVGIIQELRNTSEDYYKKHVKPIAQDWFKDNPSLHEKVEEKIKELNLK